MHEPYRDRPGAVEMVAEGGLDLGDDPDALSDFGETDSDEDRLLIRGDAAPAARQTGLRPSAAQFKFKLPSGPAGTLRSPDATSAPAASPGSMVCSYCINVLYVPAMFGL